MLPISPAQWNSRFLPTRFRVSWFLFFCCCLFLPVEQLLSKSFLSFQLPLSSSFGQRDRLLLRLSVCAKRHFWLPASSALCLGYIHKAKKEEPQGAHSCVVSRVPWLLAGLPSSLHPSESQFILYIMFQGSQSYLTKAKV